MKTLIIFDVDNTLVYSERRDSQCFADTYLELYRKPLPGINWEHYPHVTDTTIFASLIRQHFQREPELSEVESFQMRYLDLLLEKRRHDPAHSLEIPGAGQAIRRLLADDRFHLGVATGGWLQPARLKLAHVGIPTEPLLMEGADGHLTRESILSALIGKAQSEGLDPARIVYVGDALWDVRTTRNLRLNFVGIRREGDHEILLQAGAGVVISDYTDYERFTHAIAEARPPV